MTGLDTQGSWAPWQDWQLLSSAKLGLPFAWNFDEVDHVIRINRGLNSDWWSAETILHTRLWLIIINFLHCNDDFEVVHKAYETIITTNSADPSPCMP